MPKWEIVKVVKNGRRVYGAIYRRADTGREVYLAFRKISEIFRSGAETVSEAIRLGHAAWAIDDDTLRMLRHLNIAVVGVRVNETDKVYLTAIENFFNSGKVMNFTSRGGALQRYLPLQHFRTKDGRCTPV